MCCYIVRKFITFVDFPSEEALAPARSIEMLRSTGSLVKLGAFSELNVKYILVYQTIIHLIS